MFRIVDAIATVVIIVGTVFGMRYVNELDKHRSLQLHELSEDITHLRIIIENQNKRERDNTRPWGGK